MAEKSNLHLPVIGSTIERSIINVLNTVTDIIYETIVKPNDEKLKENVQVTDNLKQSTIDIYEQQLDTEYELELAKDEIVDQMEQQLDLEFRVSQLEDNMGC